MSDDPKRVAMISVHTSPLEQPGTGDAGGLNVYVAETAKQLARRGIEVDIRRDGSLDMDDPWYGEDDAFDQTYAEVIAAADGVVEHVRGALDGRAPTYGR